VYKNVEGAMLKINPRFKRWSVMLVRTLTQRLRILC